VPTIEAIGTIGRNVLPENASKWAIYTLEENLFFPDVKRKRHVEKGKDNYHHNHAKRASSLKA
jgi:hypothetical protein